MHPEAAAGAQAMLDARIAFKPGLLGSDPACGPLCLDIGGQAINGDVRAMLGPSAAWEILDIVPGPGVTIVADATEPGTWNALLGRFDVVLCTEVLEHVERWERVVDCCGYALKDNGTLILTCASTNRPPHGANGEPSPDGQWYANVDPDRLRHALYARFTASEVTYQYPPGDAYAWAYAPRG